MEKKIGVGVGVMILRDGMVLLGKRNEDPEKADSELHGEGTWTMPGGKMEFGESFEEAAIREVREETGLIVDKNSLRLISVSNDRKEDAQFVTIGFLCEDFEGEPKVMEPEEIVEWKWFETAKYPLNMFFPSEKILNNYFDNTVYKNE
jgi:8-oxo-dGTP diphosphatase